MLRQKGYTFINVVGLAFGMTSLLLITQFVRHERAYDTHYKDFQHIYRLIEQEPGNFYLGTDYYAVTPPPLAGVLREHYPEVRTASSIRNRSALISSNDAHYWEAGLWADEFFLDLFSLDLIRGNNKTALLNTHSILLTESISRKIFGDQDPINQMVVVGDSTLHTVTGILPDVPVTSSLKYSFVTPHRGHPGFARSTERNIWGSSNVHTFLALKEQASAQDFASKLEELVLNFRYRGNTDLPEAERDRYVLQALGEIHLGTYLNFDIGFHGETQNGVKGSALLLYIFIAIGIVILLLACINYMNLAVARSIRRANEVGLRKSAGAEKGQIMRQFLSESVLISLLALILAAMLSNGILPLFAHLVDRPLELITLSDVGLLTRGVLLVLVVGLISGSYPALYMASLQPATIVKGPYNARRSRFNFQRILIISQYAASIALVACGLVIYQQLKFVQNKELGFQIDHVAYIEIQQDNEELRKGFDRLKASWLTNPGVSEVAASSSLPVYTDWQGEISGWEGSEENEFLPVYINAVSLDYIELFRIEMAAGRPFSAEVASDITKAAVINESAAKALGWEPYEAVGKTFFEGRSNSERTIIGVARDFHSHSMHLEISPYVFFIAAEETDYASSLNYISARINPINYSETIAAIKESARGISPYPFEFRSVIDEFDKLYSSDKSLGETIGFFTIIALIIASMGLYGLAAFTTEKRTKEIGIRKVLGASVSRIVHMLVKEFTWLVVIAALLGTPIAYLAMHYWLEGFVYRIQVGPEVFILTTLGALFIALTTVGHQALRAALSDPVKNLR